MNSSIRKAPRMQCTESPWLLQSMLLRPIPSLSSNPNSTTPNAQTLAPTDERKSKTDNVKYRRSVMQVKGKADAIRNIVHMGVNRFLERH